MPAVDTQSVLIRSARIGDAFDIARLSGALGYPVDATVMPSRLAGVLASPMHAVFVAEAGGEVVGWICIEQRTTLESGESFEITGLVVDPAQRRRNTGRRLVEHAAAWVQAQGGAAVIVRSNVAREESHAFYALLSFERCKTQHVYRRTPGS